MKRALPFLVSAVLVLPALAFAQPQPPQAPPAPGPGGRGPRMGMGMGMRGGGIPPGLAQRVGISDDLQKKVKDAAFDANAQLINLKADLQRAQLELQKLLAQDKVDQKAVMAQLDKVTQAQGNVRKNRMGLMLKIRDILGPDLWKKLQAEMPQGRRIMRREFRRFGDASGGAELPPPPDMMGDEGGGDDFEDDTEIVLGP